MDYYGPSTSRAAGTATLPARPVYTVAAPEPMTPSRVVLWTLGQLLLGLLTFLFGVVGSIVVTFAFGTYTGSDVTATDVHSAHQGQLALLAITLWASVPWLATAARRRPRWQLQALIGILVAIVPLTVLGQHLAVTDWRSAFV